MWGMKVSQNGTLDLEVILKTSQIKQERNVREREREKKKRKRERDNKMPRGQLR